ncbi:uncharacterized protein LOC113337122 isoform X2 [Papaver somniferum]|uniref:uncharacterized protein LOC113337122 isoform X2 n=1 Tax=Papaver somniferum TaxID=3469 RepID=UPI000E6F8D84|nr:uncharacterized protein LOC113337122 isoform X2 [Papaver somniferum]
MTDFRRMAIGPTFATVSYNSYFINGYLFYTADAEKNLTTQNSGVTMDACTSFRASSKDTNLVDDDTTYYGILQLILELDYGVFSEIIFLCDWVRVEDKVHGSYVDADTKLRDVTREHWNLVLESPIRSDPNKNALEDPFFFTANANEAPSILTTVGDGEYWNGEAQGTRNRDTRE